mmetsp:Transcript_10889/g.22253  ORF Transcript_10889/g.22253 Transcript_10889/m.22253 type:complete len:558 (-) Transcript_10889:788-2461(-)
MAEQTLATDNLPPKCPCCSNPWSAATGEFFTKLCQECEAKSTDGSKEKRNSGLSRSNMDFDRPPGQNFYLYSNGNWMKENPIPAGYPSWNSFMALRIKSQEDLKDILTGLQETLLKDQATSVGEEEKKVADFYLAALDENAIENLGVEPLRPLLDLCAEAWSKRENATEYAKCLGKMTYYYHISPFFGIGASPDMANSSHSIAQVYQGGIKLPDRDYYFDEDKEEKRASYKQFMALMLTLLDDPSATSPSGGAIATAEKVFDLEKSLAEAHMTKTENRDPHDTYNKMSIHQLSNLGKGAFDFATYFESATGGKSVDQIGDINVRNVKALETAAQLAQSTESCTLLSYFRWISVVSCAPYLPKAFVQAHFDFYEKTLQGTVEIKPRWKRAMEFTENALGEALGKLYCAKYFDEESKERALTIVEQVRKALEERLKEVDWMKSETTRENALKKMSNFGVKIGYPAKWIDYESLRFEEGEPFLSMVLKARKFANDLEVKEINSPTDRQKWFMTPQTVNAYYHPSLNEVVFPAAILQHPFFDKDADDAVNFGSMGGLTIYF